MPVNLNQYRGTVGVFIIVISWQGNRTNVFSSRLLQQHNYLWLQLDLWLLSLLHKMSDLFTDLFLKVYIS